MKTLLLISFCLCFSYLLQAQITSPIKKAGFGIDADLRANYFNGFIDAGNDDWFNNGTTGTGQFVIDTNGAASMYNRYLTDPNFRKLPFFRTMRVPQFSIVNNRLWIDAVYIRDYNGQSGGDSTAFVLSNKNGDSPENWKGGITSVLDKNDIAEMMIHVRRAGPKNTDSLWFMSGLSLQGTVGNRYFDFELYQTDIFYSRSTGKFSNYGPDAGHTSWQFDAAGNIIKPGDVIFSAEYSSSSLTNIEARIWVDKNELSMNPVAFDWTGNFDGASTSSQYGYAGIKPKTTGAYYTGLQSDNGTWAGPFGFIDGGNNLVTTYSARQFMEFSVNLTKLGLDPITIIGGSACGLPFRRILVKTRTSTSFSSELKDFIGPFDFFTTPKVKSQAVVPMFCGTMGVSEIKVMNPLPSSVYTWSTPNGRIVGDSVGASITVDRVGTYIVSQQLLDGCSTQSKDTSVITFDAYCMPLIVGITDFKGVISNKKVVLSWTTASNEVIESFEVQRSSNEMFLQTVQIVNTKMDKNGAVDYFIEDDVSGIKAPYVFYRIKINNRNGDVEYSKTIKVKNDGLTEELFVVTNPVANYLQISLQSTKRTEANITIYDLTGNTLYRDKCRLQEGANIYTINKLENWRRGMYILAVQTDREIHQRKILLMPYSNIK
ncbi:MAG: T9SS type A sorting domain-containing protein [Flavisolibacter sp.]|nr:T9SS type A sorting domain-containing protein [Flavisolibacter sp.]